MKNLDVTSREIIVQPGPFRSPKVMAAEHGQSIRDIVETMYLESGTPEYLRGLNLVVEVDGEPANDWSMVPGPESHVLIYARLHGGGGGGKNPLRTLLSLAVIFAAPQVAGLLQLGPLLNAGVILGGTGMSILTAGAAAAGLFLVDMIAPVRMHSMTSPFKESYADSPTYSIAGAKNRSNPWGPIPVPLGKHRFYPPYAAEPYTEILGGDEYLRMLFAWYGPTQVKNIRLGDTRIAEFEGVEMQVREGWPGDEGITLFPSSVFQDGIGANLVQADGWVTRTARAGSDEITVDIACPRGLVEFDDQGNRTNATVAIEIEYGPTGGSDWTAYDEEIPLYVSGVGSQSTGFASLVAGVNVQSGMKVPLNDPGTWSVYVSNPAGNIYVQKSTSAISGSYRLAEYTVATVTSGDRTYNEITSLTNLYPEGVEGLVCEREQVAVYTGVRYEGERFYEYVYKRITVTSGTAGVVDSTQLSFTDKTTSAVRRGFSWRVDRDIQYDVRVRRTTADSTSDQVVDEIAWLNMKSIVDDHPINYPYPLGIIALKIKATEQLQNVVDELNFDVGAYASIWDSAEEEWKLPVVLSTVFNFRWGVAATDSRYFPAIGTYSIYVKDGFEAKTYVEMHTEGLISYEAGTAAKTGYTRVAEFVVAAGEGAYSAQRRVSSLTNLAPVGVRGLTFEYETRVITYMPPYGVGYFSSISVASLRPTSNPAALMRHVLMHPANARARTEAQIDNDALGEWYEFCENAGLSYNGIRDFRSSVWDTCADIAAVGRASPTLRDGKWSVAVDRSDKSVVQHITPRNSWGFSAEKILSYKPHAFRVKFIDEENGYQWAERIVYDDDYSAANATLFEQIEFPGVTNSELAWRFGRYHIAQARLRPERYSVYQDFEHLVLYRGAKCRLSHDILLVGLGAGRIKSLTLNEAETHVTHIVFDETFAMEAGEAYGIWIRLNSATGGTLSDGELYLSVVTEVGQSNTLELSAQLPVADAPEVGDLASFGETDQETIECLVHSVHSHSDFTAQLTLVPYGEDIYDADTGQIADWDPVITQPIDVTKQRPRPPEIRRMEAGEEALKIDKYGATSRIIVHISHPGNVRTSRYKIRFRPKKVTGGLVTRSTFRVYDYPWSYAESDNKTLVCSDVQDKLVYELQAQAISAWGVPSLWSEIKQIYVIGQSDLPADVTNFAVNIIGGEAHLSWDEVDDRDLSHYVIRWTAEKTTPTWANSFRVIDKVARPATSVSVPVQIGSYLIKAVDYAGNESENATAMSTAISRVAGMNVVEEVEQSTAGGWDGTGDGAQYNDTLDGVTLQYGDWPDENMVKSWTNVSYDTFSSTNHIIHSANADDIANGSSVYAKSNAVTLIAGRKYSFLLKLQFGYRGSVDLYFADSLDITTPLSDVWVSGGSWSTDTRIDYTATGSEGDVLVLRHTRQAAGTGSVFIQGAGGDTDPFIAELDLSLAYEQEGTYTLADTIDLGSIFTSRVTGELDVEGTEDTNIYNLVDMYDAPNLYESTENKYSASIEIRTTDDDPAGTPTWSAWKTLVAGDYTARGYQVRLRLKGTPPNITPIVTRAKVTIDMPDRVIEIVETVPVAGKAVVFAPAFHSLKGLAVNMTDGESGDYFKITGQDESGFQIHCYQANYESEYPSAHSDDYVKATTKYSENFWPYYATDPTKSLTGSASGNGWTSALYETTNQRFHIDLGSAKVINKIYYENHHASGLASERGVRNFTLWGSNSADSFAELTYATDIGWTQITTSETSFDEHIASDVADPKYITVTNTTPYRYYAFKFADNHGGTSFIGLRHIELQTNTVERDIFGIAKGHGEVEA